MTCLQAQQAILDASNAAELASHVAACAACGEFAQAQHDLDQLMTAQFADAHISPGFRSRLYGHIADEPRRWWAGLLPDCLNLAGAATVLVWVWKTYPGLDWMVVSAAVVAASLTSILVLARSQVEEGEE